MAASRFPRVFEAPGPIKGYTSLSLATMAVRAQQQGRRRPSSLMKQYLPYELKPVRLWCFNFDLNLSLMMEHRVVTRVVHNKQQSTPQGYRATLTPAQPQSIATPIAWTWPRLIEMCGLSCLRIS